jgi:hypothetical protein
MANTPRLSIPIISSSQSQKEVTHADGLRMIDCFVQGVVQDKDLTTSPTGTEGYCYIMAGNGGSWSSGTTKDIAQYYGGAWHFYHPFEGMRFYVLDEDKDYRYDGSAWSALT